MSIILHEFEPQAGGLGDLFRSILSYFALCRRENIHFYVSLEKVPLLQACFTCVKHSQPLTSTYTKRSIGDYDGTSSILDTIQLAKTFDSCEIRITSNGTIFHEKELLHKSIPFLFQIIQPSPIVVAKLESIYLQENIRPKQYVCVHIRTGDRILEFEQNGSQTSSDYRINYNSDDVVTTFHQNIQTWKHKFGFNLPIYILSDSLILRKALLPLDTSYHTLNTQIQHTANGFGKNNEESYCSTVTEFYFLQNAHTIYMPIYSGFSHIASVLGNCELATPIQTHCMFTHMGPAIIHHIP